MGWNIEIATVRVPQDTPLQDLVPDVFEPTDKRVGWEDATSVMRDTDLCAGWHNGWGIVVDVNCRLSAAGPYLKEMSAKTEMFVFRVASLPVEVHYKHGKQVSQYTGLEAILRALGKSKPKGRGHVDGETIARDWIQSRTGLDFTDDSWGVEYAVFAPP
jgi:hypothetical protein